MKWRDVYFKHSHNVLSCKWYNNKYVLLLASITEAMGTYSTVHHRMKISSLDTWITCL